MASWLESLRAANKTCIVQDNKRKVHYSFGDGKEMAEEYDMKTNELLLRKWRKLGTIGGQRKWECEVGEELLPRNMESEGLVESNTSPQFVRKDTAKTFQWRIRNLPYPLETYDVTANADERAIIVRTKNKKYYKKFNVPDMDRLGLQLQASKLSLAHANNTLIITYQKPAEVLTLEATVQEELKKMKASKDGDVECNPS